MTDVQKFYADIQRIIRHDRADNNGNYNGIRASKAVMDLFIKQNPSLAALPASIADYWFETYIQNSATPADEPTNEHVDWLACALSLLDGTIEDDQNFSKKDWANIKDLINYEAEDLPIDVLSSLMTTIVERGVL